MSKLGNDQASFELLYGRPAKLNFNSVYCSKYAGLINSRLTELLALENDRAKRRIVKEKIQQGDNFFCEKQGFSRSWNCFRFLKENVFVQR